MQIAPASYSGGNKTPHFFSPSTTPPSVCIIHTFYEKRGFFALRHFITDIKNNQKLPRTLNKFFKARKLKTPTRSILKDQSNRERGETSSGLRRTSSPKKQSEVCFQRVKAGPSGDRASVGIVGEESESKSRFPISVDQSQLENASSRLACSLLAITR